MAAGGDVERYRVRAWSGGSSTSSRLIAHVDGLLVQIWEGPAPRAAAYDAVPPVLDDDARRNGVRPACLVVVAPSSELPDAEARQRGATLPRHISFYVGVHEGSGFRASLLRMVIASIAMMSRDSPAT